MNPILPAKYYIPDVEARQWSDGKVYLYGSKDISGNDDYCSYEYQVFSSEDMRHWQEHDISFTSYELGEASALNIDPLYAPDCICYNDKYYLFYCQSNNSEGVAVSDSPTGPFKNAREIVPANGDAFDPAIFIDDDGSIYYLWGQVHARGGKLNYDMVQIEEGTFTDNILTEWEHGFHEGISIRKRNGLYYLVYADISRGRPTCLGYAISKSPLGPYEKKGIIIDNTGCDPKSWNNHGSIAEINGKWYVFYHRSTHNSVYSRHVCVEPIFFNEDGTINEVEMTTQGIDGPISCREPMDAARACLLNGGVYIDDFSNAELVYEYLTNIHNYDWVAYKYINFDEPVNKVTVFASSLSYGGIIEFRLDSVDGELVCEIPIKRTSGKYDFQAFSVNISKSLSGVHALYLCFIGLNGKLMNIKGFQFAYNN